MNTLQYTFAVVPHTMRFRVKLPGRVGRQTKMRNWRPVSQVTLIKYQKETNKRENGLLGFKTPACSAVTVVSGLSAAIAIGAPPLHGFKLERRVLASGAGESEGDRECRGHTAAEARPAMPACMPGAAADRRPSPVAQPRRRGDAADAGHQLCALPMAERPRQRPATGAAADETACSLRITHEASPPAVGGRLAPAARAREGAWAMRNAGGGAARPARCSGARLLEGLHQSLGWGCCCCSPRGPG